jgi:hypothetical protein
MQDFKSYSVDLVKSLTLPLPYAVRIPPGQSTAHSNVNIDPSEPVTVVRFWPGHGFAAIPVVPDVTGADDVLDGSETVVVSEEEVSVVIEFWGSLSALDVGEVVLLSDVPIMIGTKESALVPVVVVVVATVADVE